MPYPVAAVRGKNNEAGSGGGGAPEVRITENPVEDRETETGETRITE
jgi:hypothetical protein